MATTRRPDPPKRAKRPVGDTLTDKAAAKAEKLHAKAEKLQTTVERISTRAKVQAESLERLAARLESVELWMRDEPGQRQARFTRSELAQTAIRIADTEGLDALSMRRLAAELGAGTMTLYHYVRTKDELLTLVSDEVMGEVLLPEGHVLPTEWTEAIVVVASRSREAMRRHPWVFDVRADLGLGPNGVRHMDQTLQAVDSIDASLATKLDLVAAVDEYVFGYCLQEWGGWSSDHQRDTAAAYVEDLVRTGDYPQLQRYVDEMGIEAVWQAFEDNGSDATRFERNLRRFVRGIEQDLVG
jgi:AcrR family transcriptional regulator